MLDNYQENNSAAKKGRKCENFKTLAASNQPTFRQFFQAIV